MPTYMAPGIYIEEIATGPRPIQAVGTSTAGFVGEAPDAGGHLNEPVGVNNWSHFVKAFAPPGRASPPLSHAVFGFFQNGGSRCFVINVGQDGGLGGGGGRRTGLELL